MAVGGAILDDRVGFLGTAACLLSAVTDTISKVLVGAVADGVALCAAKRRLGNGEHVANTSLTAGRERTHVLGEGSADDSEDSEGLHLVLRGWKRMLS